MGTGTTSLRRLSIVACSAALVASIAGCSSPSNYATTTQAASEEYAGATAEYDMAYENGESATYLEAEGTEGDKGTTEASETTVIIKNASVGLRTRDYDAALESVRTIIEEANGSQVSSNESGGNGRSITIEARVDPDKVEDAVERLRTIEGCTVLYANLSSSDVTRTFNDTERRIEILEEQYNHYKTMLESATTTEDMLLISDHMYDVMAEIKVLTDQRDDMAHDAAHSLLTVSIDEELAGGQTGETQRSNIYADAWEDAWGFLGTAIETLILLAIFLIPFALLAGLIFIVVLLIRRSGKTKRANKQATDTATGSAEQTEVTEASEASTTAAEAEATEKAPKDPDDGKPQLP